MRKKNLFFYWQTTISKDSNFLLTSRATTTKLSTIKASERQPLSKCPFKGCNVHVIAFFPPRLLSELYLVLQFTISSFVQIPTDWWCHRDDQLSRGTDQHLPWSLLSWRRKTAKMGHTSNRSLLPFPGIHRVREAV